MSNVSYSDTMIGRPWNRTASEPSVPCPMCGAKDDQPSATPQAEIVRRMCELIVAHPREVFIIACQMTEPDLTHEQIGLLHYHRRLSRKQLGASAVAKMMRRGRELLVGLK